MAVLFVVPYFTWRNPFSSCYNIHYDVSMLWLRTKMLDYFFLVISSTRRFLVVGSSLADTLSSSKPTITSKILFTLLRNSVGSLRTSSVSEIRYSVLLVQYIDSVLCRMKYQSVAIYAKIMRYGLVMLKPKNNTLSA